ncbi:MAG: dockerin type I domain-containing protein [Microgenomates group bacterium]|nr:dockerin type I domain-containing protein [Microgenomates group bacterium]
MKKNNKFFLIIILFSVFLILVNLTFVLKRNRDLRLKAQTADLSLSLTPRDYVFQSNSEKEALLTLNNPTGKKIVGVNLAIKYNPNVIQAENLLANAGSDKPFTDNFSPSINNQAGEVRIVLFADKNDADLSSDNTIVLATIKFKAVGGGKSDIFIDQDYEVIGFSLAGDDYKLTLADLTLGIWQAAGPSITLEPTRPAPTGNITNQPTPTPTITPTPIPAGETQLNIELKLQGVVKKPEKTTSLSEIEVVVKGETLKEQKKQTISLTANNQAVWQGKATFTEIPLSPEKIYQVEIKVPKHLKIEVQDLILTEGENDFDLSERPVLAGDVNDDEIINSYDLAYVRNNLNTTKAEILKNADFNLDGVVNASDFSLVVSSLTILTK